MELGKGEMRTQAARLTVFIFLLGAFPATQHVHALAQGVMVSPASLPKIAVVDDRFQSYNVEMLSITGGAFWRPYDNASASEARDAGPSPSALPLYQQRPPIDLDHPRLRRLAAALGPAYVRVSGTWANTTFFADQQEMSAPPPGFSAVLTATRWRGLIDFAKAVNADVVTSFAISAGARDGRGGWTSEQAKRWLDATRAAGGRIAAVEFMNEPTLATMNGAPAGYDATRYGQDFRTFYAFIRQEAPATIVLGPGAVGEEVGPPLLRAADLLAASEPDVVDAVSYHHYGALSRRCAGNGAQTSAEEALSEQWLARTDTALAFFRRLRDKFAAGKPIWLTETADAACGGNPWASSFLDTFRYLDQLGRLAQQDVQVVMHNTLVWSDYGLLDEQTFRPRPNYWAALLWRQLMGPVVLDSGVARREGLHLYAHCLRGEAGGVALLAINTSRTQTSAVKLPPGVEVRRFTLSAATLESLQVRLNGRELSLGERDALPDLSGETFVSDALEFAPATLSFVAVPKAGNQSCE